MTGIEACLLPSTIFFLVANRNSDQPFGTGECVVWLSLQIPERTCIWCGRPRNTVHWSPKCCRHQTAYASVCSQRRQTNCLVADSAIHSSRTRIDRVPSERWCRIDRNFWLPQKQCNALISIDTFIYLKFILATWRLAFQLPHKTHAHKCSICLCLLLPVCAHLRPLSIEPI